MNSSSRRDLLKLSPLAFAAAAAAAPAAFAQAPGATAAPMFFDVRSFGATGSGKTLDTAGINKAIEAAAGAGGGTVIFPAGQYLTFSIRLKSYVHLYLSQGATIVAAGSPRPGETTGEQGGTYDAAEPENHAAAYGSIEAYQDYGHNHWHNSLIWGEDIHDVSITGPGRIFGKGLSFGAARDPRGDYTTYAAAQPGVGHKAIAMKNCRNVLFRDFQILKGGHFGLLLTGVDNLTIDNLTIDTDRDGMDIDCCKNVRVSNCYVNSPWDDAICPKSSFALGYNRPTENVVITNCYTAGSYMLGAVLDGTFRKIPPGTPGVARNGRIKCGTESNGGFKNITISNCTSEGCQGLALESVDGALCEDITITNQTFRDLVNGPFFFRLGGRLRGPRQVTQVGALRRVLVDNCVSYNSDPRVSSIITGIPGHPIEDIKFSNIFIQHQGGGTTEMSKATPYEGIDQYPDPGRFGTIPAHGFYLRHINRLEMSHIEVQPVAPDARPAFALIDVNRADFLAITAPTNPPAFSLSQVKDLRIAFSRAAKDTQLATADNQSR
jgi:polygalacturonase